MRTCALCGKDIIARDVCTDCWREWGNTPTGTFYPEWATDLIKMQKRFETRASARDVLLLDVSRKDMLYAINKQMSVDDHVMCREIETEINAYNSLRVVGSGSYFVGTYDVKGMRDG